MHFMRERESEKEREREYYQTIKLLNWSIEYNQQKSEKM